MDMDPDVANWVLELFLRQSLENRSLNYLVGALPLPKNNPNLKKSMLLKKLECEVSGRLISETTLELLEHLEELEFQQENETVSDAMKRAYCAVAVECTVKVLEAGDDGDHNSSFKFFEAVRRVWRGRIGRMERIVEKGGLVSPLLLEWKDEIEAAVWDDNVCERVVKKIKEVDAVEMVNTYVREEMEKMSPSFLELVAERATNDEVMQGILRVDVIDQIAGKEAPLSCVVKVSDRNNACEEMHEITTKPSYKNYNLPRSSEVNKIWKALELSSLELQAVVRDPLPDALRLAEAISIEERKNNHVKDFVVDGAGDVQAISGGASNAPEPSFMERSSSAHTYEWDDSIDGSQEDPTCRGMLQLPSPGMLNNSPLVRYETKNLKKRRKARRTWSLLEEDTLRSGVEKYGKGNWKVIRTAYGDIFEGRTEHDLKDKWRNLTRC